MDPFDAAPVANGTVSDAAPEFAAESPDRRDRLRDDDGGSFDGGEGVAFGELSMTSVLCVSMQSIEILVCQGLAQP